MRKLVQRFARDEFRRNRHRGRPYRRWHFGCDHRHRAGSWLLRGPGSDAGAFLGPVRGVTVS